MHKLSKELKEFKNQINFSTRIGFLFGAGTSCALGIPNLDKLTAEVEKKIKAEYKPSLDKIKKHLSNIKNSSKNIEEILNQLRLIRQITNESKDVKFLDIDGETAKLFDKDICDNIYTIIKTDEEKVDISNIVKFFLWYNWLNRDFTKEIFTTNYDLVIEKCLEFQSIPYFDGFIGSYEPFFLPESIESTNSLEMPPIEWIRLWKLHGSLGWFWKKDTERIIRLGKVDDKSLNEDEVVIYPSREKYVTSRKQPFISYFDRLKNYLRYGDLHFIVAGFSFGDQHINEILFDALRQNNKLQISTFLFSEESFNNVKDLATSYLNINVYSPNKAIIRGKIDEYDLTDLEEVDKPFVIETKKELLLGDFIKLIEFIVLNSGQKEKIESYKK
ncbi:MAG TPA: SIR2 family protein [Ignavibacteria bacterium]